MIFERIENVPLAQSAYLLASPASKEAVVIDPLRDPAPYLEAASRLGVRIVAVTETHIHADFLSGSRHLARAAGAQLYLSALGGEDWSYAYADSDGAILLRDRDIFDIGTLRVEALHTPGHTPEHLSFLVTDTARAGLPLGIATGDFVFVGDVGRPDLLERVAGVTSSMESAARQLFESLRRFRALPDYLQLWPGHGAGSACGKSLSPMPQSTVGFEKLFNWALARDDETSFVREVLDGQPTPPPYFGRMKQLNRDGPPPLPALSLAEIPAASLAPRLDGDAIVVDARPGADWLRGHLANTLSLSWGKSFLSWAGWMLPYDRPITLFAERDVAAAAARALALIGLDWIEGWVPPSALSHASLASRIRSTPVVGADEVERHLRDHAGAAVVDVRQPGEWNAGHLPGARHIPLGLLPDRAEELPSDRPIVVHCQAGGRSVIAASVLERAGIRHVLNYGEGFAGWRGKVERG